MKNYKRSLCIYVIKSLFRHFYDKNTFAILL